jgi:LmbE family N-acetylglucosaminyl deacetylase
VSRVLVLAPHPDDESIGCGGSLALHASRGDAVRVVLLTSGEQGGHGVPPAEAGAVREREAAAACAVLGVERPDFWRQPDGALRASERLIGRLSALLHEWRPSLVYAPHRAEAHPDHRAASDLLAAVLLKATEHPQVRLYEIWTPLQRFDEVIDITEVIDTKVQAIRAHETQCRVMRFDDAARALNRYRGEMHSWPGGEYAEVFAAFSGDRGGPS